MRIQTKQVIDNNLSKKAGLFNLKDLIYSLIYNTKHKTVNFQIQNVRFIIICHNMRMYCIA
jgi:hypothetical protein